MEETSMQENPMPRRGSSFAGSVLDWVEAIVMAVVLVAIVFTFVARVITVMASRWSQPITTGTGCW